MGVFVPIPGCPINIVSEKRMGDVWGGLTAMLVALPASIAFGLLIYAPLGGRYAAVGAVSGMLGAVVIGLVASLFGGTPRLISAPCAPAAAVLSAIVVEFVQAPATSPSTRPDADQVLALIAVIALAAGALQLLFASVGGGQLIKYIPYPVVAGYLSGVGVLIVLSQMPKLFGFPEGTGLWAGVSQPEVWQWTALGVGAVTVTAMLTAHRVSHLVPAPIMALVAGMAAYLAFGLARPELLTLAGNPHVIGALGGEGGDRLAALTDRWASFTSLDLHLLQMALVPALTLAVLLSIDTLKTCVITDALTRSRHDSTRELRAQGLANLASSLAGGIPGSGTLGATMVNIGSGARTRWSGALEGAFALAAFLLLGGLVAWVPVAALAGILIVVAARMVDRNIFQLLRKASTRFDFAVVAAVVVTAVGANLIAAAGVGTALAILLFIRAQAASTVVRRKSSGDHMFSKRRRLPEQVAMLADKGSRTAIYELQGNLFFGTTDRLFTELETDLQARRYVILDMRRVQSVDFTAVHLLEQIETRLAEKGGSLLFSGLPPNLPSGQDLQAYFDEVGLVKSSGQACIFDELDDALEWVEDRILEEENLVATSRAPLALRDLDLFRGFDDSMFEALAACIRERSCVAGERIFGSGDKGDELFVVRRGRVRIMLPIPNGKPHHLATFSRGDFFGDMAFLDRRERSADAVAEAPTDLYVLSRARFDEMAERFPAMGKRAFSRLARALAIRLRQADAELQALE